MAGWWRWIYGRMGWKYVSKNDVWDDRQQHLKFMLCKEVRASNLNKIIGRDKDDNEDDDNDIIPYAEKV